MREEISLVGNEAQVVVLFLHKYTQHKYSPDPGCLQRQVLGGVVFHNMALILQLANHLTAVDVLTPHMFTARWMNCVTCQPKTVG